MSFLTNRRTIFSFLVLGLIVVGFTIYQFSGSPQIKGAVITPPKPMPNFTLQSARGPVALSDFRGKFVVLYFGYTNCPDVCPLTLANLRQAMDKIGDKAADVQVIFVSVDWKRDTPEKLSAYAGAFRPDFIGLTGSQQQIDSVTKDFGIFYLFNISDANGYYSVDHTATDLVLDRDGNLILTWSNGTPPEDIASDLAQLVKK